ncbi:hypothetical protein [Leisingera caerulea]|uniref:hypothetical protein n=1 Tax=Leisingera caerulea TaxID=506591 RepID=UPI0004019489|nr:hypothetical protein [Leisingera caerulea]
MGILVIALYLAIPLGILAIWSIGWMRLLCWFQKIADGRDWVFGLLIFGLFGLMAIAVQVVIHLK